MGPLVRGTRKRLHKEPTVKLTPVERRWLESGTTDRLLERLVGQLVVVMFRELNAGRLNGHNTGDDAMGTKYTYEGTGYSNGRVDEYGKRLPLVGEQEAPSSRPVAYLCEESLLAFLRSKPAHTAELSAFDNCNLPETRVLERLRKQGKVVKWNRKQPKGDLLVLVPVISFVQRQEQVSA